MRKTLAVLASIFALVTFATVANAAPPTKVKPSSFTLSVGNDVPIAIHGAKGTYTMICFDFVFSESDPVDPGVEVAIFYPETDPGGGFGFGGGFINASDGPLYTRTTCNTQPEVLALLNDGRLKGLVTTTGSSVVTSLSVRMIGAAS